MGIATYRQYAMHESALQGRVFEKGVSASNSCFTVVYLCERNVKKVSISVCNYKKSGNAVKRNKMKRVTKELLDNMIVQIKPCSLSILPKASILKYNPVQRKQSLIKILKKNNLLLNEAS